MTLLRIRAAALALLLWNSCAAQDRTVYADTLTNGWVSYGWATLNYGNAAPVHSGSKSIAVTATAYQALYLHHPAFDSGPYSAVSFWIHGGAAGGQLLRLQVRLSGVDQTQVFLPPLPAGAWLQVSIPLADLGAGNRPDLDGIVLQDRSGVAQPTFFVDDISLVSGPLEIATDSALPAAVAGSVYTQPLTAKGGTAPFSWAVAAGSLPGGLSLDSDGTVKGTPAAAGNSSFTAEVTDAAGTTAGKSFSLAVIAPPVISLGDGFAFEGNASPATGFFHTQGNRILDAADRPVRISGVSWFGMDTPNFAPHGLWTRGYKPMMDQMKQLGFNTIRLPFCNQAFDAGSVPNSIDTALNPDLAGLDALHIMDKIVAYAGQIGLRVYLDRHRSDANGSGPNGNGLWATAGYPESRWISDWEMLAARYAGNPSVIGADLHNEPHGPATWGSGNLATDWRLAAERCGNAVLAVNPNWLIIVEGVENGASGSYWWGGNLSAAGAFPVRLAVADRLVYSPHDYCASVFAQSWFGAPNYPANLPALWDAKWGYLHRQGIAPILIGEFGTKLETAPDRQWLDQLIRYLGDDMSWTWWSWNPNSGDTGGILTDDWQGVQTAKLDKLRPVQFSFETGAASPIRFTVKLNPPSPVAATVGWSTANGTALAGADYAASSGSVTFAPGEVSKTISLPLVSDTVSEPTESFAIELAGPANAVLGRAGGTGTIMDDDSRYGLWAAGNFSAVELADPAIAGSTADPDGDGLPNFLEYAFARNPKHTEGGPVVRGSIESDHAVFRYTRLLPPRDFICHGEVSADLTSWSEISEFGATEDGDATTETVEIRLTQPVGEPTFFRLRVSQP